MNQVKLIFALFPQQSLEEMPLPLQLDADMKLGNIYLTSEPDRLHKNKNSLASSHNIFKVSNPPSHITTWINRWQHHWKETQEPNESAQ